MAFALKVDTKVDISLNKVTKLFLFYLAFLSASHFIVSKNMFFDISIIQN